MKTLPDLNEIQYFSWVAQTESFSAAAKQAGIPKSTLSRKVADLERRLGVTLLKRTTRKVQLTDVGQAYLSICSKALAEIESAESLATETQLKPAGKIRIAAPVEMGIHFLSTLTRSFHQKYPDIELEFVLDDRVVDLIEDRIDIAIRAGALPDSNLIAQKVGSAELQLFASPAYLKKHGEPKTPKDLEKHCLLVFPNLAESNTWDLRSSGSRQKVSLKNKIVANQLNMIRTLAASDVGIALLPVFVGFETIDRSSGLVRVLEGWGSERDPVHIVHVAQPFIPHRIRIFIEAIRKAFAQRE